MWEIDRIESLMSEKDKAILKDIYSPTVVDVPIDNAGDKMFVMPDGEIRYYGLINRSQFCWEEGEDLKVKECYKYSRDGGLTWKFSYAPKGCVGACLYVPEKEMYITAKYLKSQKGFCIITSKIGPNDTNPQCIKISDTQYSAFRLPIRIMNGKRIVVLTYYGAREEQHSAFIYSDDYFKTWNIVKLKAPKMWGLKYPAQSIDSDCRALEPSVLELGDGKLMILARTSTNYFYSYYSDDNGQTWSDGELSNFHATTTFPNFFNMQDGRKLLFWNNSQPLYAGKYEDYIVPFYHRNGWDGSAFTNRDVNHCAYSYDGKTWHGFREMFLNTIRNNADFRMYGGNDFDLDKSIHQFQVIELPFKKLLVAFGQHHSSRKIIIFDPDWLKEKERQEDFSFGLENISTQLYVKSYSGCWCTLGHNAWNRTNGALLVPSPELDGREVLQICRITDPRLVSDKQGAVWNYPLAQKGKIEIELYRLKSGVKISLCDRWFNPCDDYLYLDAIFHFALTEENVSPCEWHNVVIDFDLEKKMVQVSLGEKKILEVPATNQADHGLSYLHVQTDSEGYDDKGTLIKSIKMIGEK